MYETVNVPDGSVTALDVVLMKGETILDVGVAPAITAETALDPDTENETVCPAQTGFGVGTTVPVGAAITLRFAVVVNVQPSALLPVIVKALAPAVVGVKVAVAPGPAVDTPDPVKALPGTTVKLVIAAAELPLPPEGVGVG